MRDLVALVMVIGIVVTSCSNGSSTTTNEANGTDGSSTSITIPEDTEHGIVSGVVNGDTIEVLIGDESAVIRLAGIRSPQGGECYAAEASLAASELAAGRNVALVGDAVDGDGTPIRYMIIEGDIPVLINVELVVLGAAVALHGHELAGDFLRVNERAYASGNGMWGTFVCGHPEGGVFPDRPQLRIDAVHLPPAGDASIDVVNQSYTEVAVGGWTLRDAANTSSFAFPASMVLAPGDVVSVALSCDAENAGGSAWCVDPDLWSAGGNTFIIQDEFGNVVERFVHEVPETP